MLTALLLTLGLSCVPLDDRAEVAKLLEAGKGREAAELLGKLLEATPDDRGLRADLAKLEMRIGRYASALGHAEGLGPALDGLRGRALYLLGRYEEALEFLSDESGDTVLFRHEALVSLARFEEADRALERATEILGAGHTEVRVRRAQTLARKGATQSAVEEFRTALAEAPTSAPALYGLGRALITLGEREDGLTLLERHRVLLPLLDAVDFARQNLELDRSHASNHAGLGDALRALGAFDPGQFEEAERAYAEASRLAKPEEIVPVSLRHARFLEEIRQDRGRAAEVLDAALARQADPRLAVRCGDILLRAGRASDALARFEAAWEMRPGDEQVGQRIRDAREQIESEGKQ